MRYQIIDPKHAEAFKKQLTLNNWVMVKQDAGQTHLVGWGYMIEWQKNQESVSLHYKDQQGKAEAQLEMTPSAWAEVQNILKKLL
ncbi:MAG: hypothetical protein U9R28_02800 [Pseudomonadota bacterium]|nr:hypothetical protein [Pseudomonadota bacterium]